MSDWMALVAAAGAGRRFGGEGAKIWAAVAGRPALVWTLERLFAAGASEAVLALAESQLEAAAERLAEFGDRVHLVMGGESRQDSVRRALAASDGAPEQLVAVHDGARPATQVEDIRRTVEAAGLSGAAILGRPLTDTLKRVRGEAVVETLPRHDLFRAETPQVFRRELLERAHQQALADGFSATDDAALVERLSEARVRVVAALAANPKLTRLSDLEEIESLLAEAGPSRRRHDLTQSRTP